ncbi:Amino acid transporter [Methanolobus vulcani]|uniref:Amino acid transporter n=1 Tax=Methanolobus vulcani TaxID=38026 RepID=A0A7Z7B2S1_9EURY|nr:APC family permease [Methanolobus vulcani]SDG08625.1 Amino acid transporter [Methanolobus vulcani]
MSNKKDASPGIDWEHSAQCAKNICDPQELERSIDWKQGLAIALGVPLLILPSIGYLTSYVWSFAIVIWGATVLLGFLQNFAFGELATVFPKASGLPGYTQTVFGSDKDKNNKGKFKFGKFIGGFSAWSYWFGWSPVLAIYAILISDYLQGMVPALSGINSTILALIVGGFIFGSLAIINSKGLKNGAAAGFILAAISLIPLLVITIAPFFTGDFQMSNITSSWFPTDWSWDWEHILILLGLLAMAEWSAAAWETVAIYGPEYKKPNSDIPKALLVCGAICLVLYVLVQTSVIGALGVDGVLAEPISPMLPLANMSLGPMGASISIIMLIGAMLLIIQTAFLSSARSIYSMSVEGNLPSFLSKLNKHGHPMNAMLADAAFNMFLILLGTPTAILAASAIGYICANGISLYTYVKVRNDPELSKLERPFKAPKGWKSVALATTILNTPFFLIGIIYLNSLELGWATTGVGFFMLCLFIPLWIYSQRENRNKIPAVAGHREHGIFEPEPIPVED